MLDRMKLLERLFMINWLKKLMLIQAIDTSILVKNVEYDRKIVKLNRKLLMMIVVNILLLKNLIN